MERDVTTITIKDYKIGVYSFATGKDYRDIQDAHGSFISMTNGQPTVDNISMSKLDDIFIKNFVVSINDEKDDILNKVIELPVDVYKELLENIKSLLDVKKE